MAENGTVKPAHDINQAIRKMIAQDEDKACVKENANKENPFSDKDEYAIDYDAILPMFKGCPLEGKCPCKFSINVIYQRLAIVDNLYGTNIVRMRSFGLVDLAERIWELCDDGNGNHSDKVLIDKAIQFVDRYSTKQGSINNDELTVAFNGGYGYTAYSKNKLTKPEAPSILSKYIYFLFQAYMPNNIGFPIYDSIVCEYAPQFAHILKTKYMGCRSKIFKYTYMLSEIIKVLEQDDYNLWNKDNPCGTKFALLDHFLWRVGKAKNGSYSLLMTKKEYANYIQNGIVPARIKIWKNI